MPMNSPSGFGPEADRIERGELASSTETRLRELLGWGGSTSFLSPGAAAVAADAGVHPIGQVVGLATGQIFPGYVRTTRSGQGRMRHGVARWREHTGPLKSWTALRQRALSRLTQQATILGADAVIGIAAERALRDRAEDGIGEAHLTFSGTAVSVDGWRQRHATPVLTLASGQELWSMLNAGVEPAGIAGGFARVETLPSRTTALAGTLWRRRLPNMELEDLTRSFYEARELALGRLLNDAKSLPADGLLGINLELEDAAAARSPLRGRTLTVHVLASAVRRVRPSRLQPAPVLVMSDGSHG